MLVSDRILSLVTTPSPHVRFNPPICKFHPFSNPGFDPLVKPVPYIIQLSYNFGEILAAQWDSTSASGSVPQLKGAKSFTFEELRKSTNNFSESSQIGAGGYGNVYKGSLPNGQLIAIKRARQGSTQGGLEFKTELELLSRVHHKNAVGLIGFCFDQGEQMLVYEFIVNGTLKDSLSGRSGIRLDWMRRLKIALGAARWLQYLHDLADPPIILSHPQNPPADNTRFEGVTDQDPATNYTKHWLKVDNC
ncbi:putative protein kinase RLK-Pelle-LRR-VIII-1 family [Helianthus anomalus]